MQYSKDCVSCGPPVVRLYEQHALAIFAYLCQHTPTREDAEDLLVEVFASAVESTAFAQLREKERVAWLWRVARNKAVDAYRRSRLRQGVDLAQVADLIYDDGERTPEQVALRQEEYAHLRAHLEKLSHLQQQALRSWETICL